jgi:hypothetical protein
MLGHHYVTDEFETEFLSHSIEDANEYVARPCGAEQRKASVTTESEEVQVALPVDALEPFRHNRKSPRSQTEHGAPSKTYSGVTYSDDIILAVRKCKKIENSLGHPPVTKLSNGNSVLSKVKEVRSIGTRDIAVDWADGAESALLDSGFAWRPGLGHEGESGMIGKPTADGGIAGGFWQAQGIHALFTDANNGATGNIHIDYRGIFSGHYGDANDDVRQNYRTYENWFGPIPGFSP